MSSQEDIGQLNALTMWSNHAWQTMKTMAEQQDANFAASQPAWLACAGAAKSLVDAGGPLAYGEQCADTDGDAAYEDFLGVPEALRRKNYEGGAKGRSGTRPAVYEPTAHDPRDQRVIDLLFASNAKHLMRIDELEAECAKLVERCVQAEINATRAQRECEALRVELAQRKALPLNALRHGGIR